MRTKAGRTIPMLHHDRGNGLIRDSDTMLNFWRPRVGDRFIDHDGVLTHAVSFDFAIAKPAPGRLITDALLSGVIAQLHPEIIQDYALIIEDSREFLETFSILSECVR